MNALLNAEGTSILQELEGGPNAPDAARQPARGGSRRRAKGKGAASGGEELDL